MKRNKIRIFVIRYYKIFTILLSGLILSGMLVYQTILVKPEYIVVRVKGSPGNWWWVTPRPPDWLAFSIQKGDKEYNSLNQPVAEVLSVDVYDAGGSTRDAYLTVRLSVRHNKRTNQYRYKGEPVEIGGPISMSLDNAFFPGMVIAIYSDNKREKTYTEKTVRIRKREQWPYEYDSIIIGETIVDGDGIVIAEILDKQRMPAEKEAANVNGQLVRTLSPIKDDFYLTVKLKMRKQGDEYIYREEQYIKVGSNIWLLFPRYNISGADILSIE